MRLSITCTALALLVLQSNASDQGLRRKRAKLLDVDEYNVDAKTATSNAEYGRTLKRTKHSSRQAKYEEGSSKSGIKESISKASKSAKAGKEGKSDDDSSSKASKKESKSAKAKHYWWKKKGRPLFVTILSIASSRLGFLHRHFSPSVEV
jgi:hypothetical protein